MATPLIIKGQETGVKNLGEEFFATDISPGVIEGKSSNLIVEVVISLGVSPIYEITFNSGATWSEFIPALAVNILGRAEVTTQFGDLINFRNVTGGAITLRRFLVVSTPSA